MSARRIGSLTSHAQPIQHCLTLPANAVRIRKSGIEFQSEQAIAIYTELTVSLQSPRESKKVNCNGVVVACSASHLGGYTITLLFTHLSRQSQARLSAMSL